MVRKTSLASIALACLVALSLVYGLAAITVCHADNAKPYCLEPVEPQDNAKPYSPDPFVTPNDNAKPY